ncbi:MAG TPA: VOC family protein [Polyangiaceae bacterium]|jgi:predicted 3-demethylubiquinone-9 3-methyltransferase (glyoxalase superfamily)
MSKISPFLWFNSEAEEAAMFYVSLFDNSRILKVARYGKAGPRPAGTVMTVQFQLAGEDFVALNGGPGHPFTEAVSFSVSCRTQSEVDELWQKLSSGGEEGPCGWVRDRYGLSWQIVPTVLPELLSDPDPEKATRVMQAMFTMKKLDIARLERAYDTRV